ncbi:MAG: hypothetical protein NT032_00780 [Actinobacteria bacterium]|nr:hypothetical protein [Actinomycetota bacterium]
MSEIFVESEGVWRRPTQVSYANESALQQLLLDSPDLIPGIESPVAVCTEFPTEAGLIDLLVLNDEGEITIVECKLGSNAEARRKIVGQVLDYASSMWNLPLDKFLDQWKSRSGIGLQETLGTNADSILNQLEIYLGLGKFNLLLAVDQINQPLERIVTYLNAVTMAEISAYAVEFRQLEFGPTKGIVASTFGLEQVEAKEIPTSKTKQWWPDDAFRTYLTTKHPSLVSIFDAIAEVVKETGGKVVGGGAAIQNALVKQEVDGEVIWPISFYAFDDLPTLQINFHYLKKNGHRTEFLDCLTIDGGFHLDVAGIKSSGFSRKPKVLMADITAEQIQALRGALQVLNTTEEVDEKVVE